MRLYNCLLKSAVTCLAVFLFSGTMFAALFTMGCSSAPVLEKEYTDNPFPPGSVIYIKPGVFAMDGSDSIAANENFEKIFRIAITSEFSKKGYVFTLDRSKADFELILRKGSADPLEVSGTDTYVARITVKIQMVYIKTGRIVMSKWSLVDLSINGRMYDMPDALTRFAVKTSEGLPVIAKSGEKTYKIGDRGPGGGIVFYDKGIFEDGWRYLEAAPKDLPERLVWGCWNQWIGDLSSQIGSGKKNTQLIIAKCPDKKSAAYLCAQYRGGGKKDWFLPSEDELTAMYENLHKAGIGKFSVQYWSSTEAGAGAAQERCFSDGVAGAVGKDSHMCVRPVRAF